MLMITEFEEEKHEFMTIVNVKPEVKHRSREHHNEEVEISKFFVPDIWLAGFENIGIYCFSSAAWLVFIVWVPPASANAL